jgi:hypothetical protein
MAVTKACAMIQASGEHEALVTMIGLSCVMVMCSVTQTDVVQAPMSVFLVAVSVYGIASRKNE